MAASTRIEKIEYFDSERLIKEIEKQESLWNKNIPEYNDKNLRDYLWKKVCQAVISNWDILDNHSQDKTVRDVQRKWKNFRDCFRKEINLQRVHQRNPNMKKRRKYMFYDNLRFLLPLMDDKKTHQQDDSAHTSGEEAEEQILTEPENSTNCNDVNNQPVRLQKIPKIALPVQRESVLVPSYQPHEADDIDEDKYFLLSLVPTFRKLSQEQKFNAKMDILKLLKNISCPSTGSNASNFSYALGQDNIPKIEMENNDPY